MYDALVNGLFGQVLLDCLDQKYGLLGSILFFVSVIAPPIIIFISVYNDKNISVIVSLLALIVIAFGLNFFLAYLLIAVIIFIFMKKDGAI